MIAILDRLFDELPKEKDYVVDWDARKRELEELCDPVRSPDGCYDVVVPGSGGKDSAFVAHQLRERFGMSVHSKGARLRRLADPGVAVVEARPWPALH